MVDVAPFGVHFGSLWAPLQRLFSFFLDLGPTFGGFQAIWDASCTDLSQIWAAILASLS